MGNTIFDPELYQKAQEESRYLLRNMIAPPGPAPEAGKPKEEKPATSPVSINFSLGEAPGLGGEIYRGLKGMRWGTAFEHPEAYWTPPIIPSSGGGSLPGEGGFELPPWTGPKPWRLSRISDQPGWEDYTKPPIDMTRNSEGIYQMGGAPVPGRGSLSVIPGTAIGRMMTANIGGRQLTLPAGDMRDIYETQARLADKGYYAAHPEERMMDEINYQMKPFVDQYNKMLELNRSMAQGFGLPIGTRKQALARQQAAIGLESAGRALNQAMGTLPGVGQRYVETRMGIPLKETELGLRSKEVDTHRFAAEQLAKHQEQLSKYINVGPGATVIDRETGKPAFKGAFAPEQAAGLMHWSIAAATEEGLTGKTINPMTFVGVMNMMGSRMGGEGYKPITMKEVPKEWIAPYIEGRIAKTNPKLKKDSNEYKKHYQTLEKLLYMTAGE